MLTCKIYVTHYIGHNISGQIKLETDITPVNMKLIYFFRTVSHNIRKCLNCVSCSKEMPFQVSAKVSTASIMDL